MFIIYNLPSKAGVLAIASSSERTASLTPTAKISTSASLVFVLWNHTGDCPKQGVFVDQHLLLILEQHSHQTNIVWTLSLTNYPE